MVEPRLLRYIEIRSEEGDQGGSHNNIDVAVHVSLTDNFRLNGSLLPEKLNALLTSQVWWPCLYVLFFLDCLLSFFVCSCGLFWFVVFVRCRRFFFVSWLSCFGLMWDGSPAAGGTLL